MEAFLAGFQETIQHRYLLSYFVVFIGGLVSALSPCVLAAIPLIIGYVGGYSDGTKKKAVVYSAVFILGLSITFTLLGIAATVAGQFLGFSGALLSFMVALLTVAMGLHLLGLVSIPLPFQKSHRVKSKGLTGAFLLGMLTGTVSSPCATPVLAVILAYVSAKGSIFYGGTLLFTYAIGHCALIFLSGLSIGLTQSLVKSSGLRNASLFLKKASGTVLIVTGVYFIVTL